jgi:ADP-heptose:LPS heptosyltransferase
MNIQDSRVKVLIIRFSSIGDIVLTTPVIRNLKTQVEHIEVHFLTKKIFAPVLEGNPYIDKIHCLDNNFGSLMHELKQENFDFIIDLHKNLRTSRIKLGLKRMSFSFEKLNFKKWLLVNFKINRLPAIHIVDRYMKTISLFIETSDEKGLDYYVPEKDNYPINLNSPFIVIIVGANHNTKQLPDEKLIELCTRIEKPVVLLGGKADIDKAVSIESGVEKQLTNLVGKLTINQSASVVQQADWVITPDTGLMHIAAAFGKKIISVWGNTVPEFGMAAYKPNNYSVLIEQKGLKCRPCSKIGYKKCPKSHFKCMNDHDISHVASLINKLA